MRPQVFAAIVLSLTAGASYAALLGRSPATPSGTDYQAYYDSVLNITWLANANLAASETFGLTRSAGFNPAPGSGQVGLNGQMQWETANNWIAGMNTASYLGVSDWRLPSADVNGNSTVVNCLGVTEPQCRDNEMGYLRYFSTEETIWTFPPLPGPFANLRDEDYYWYGTSYAPNTSNAWVFYPNTGENIPLSKDLGVYTWVVRPGDIGIIPIPAAVWLLGSALGSLAGIKRLRRVARNGTSI